MTHRTRRRLGLLGLLAFLLLLLLWPLLAWGMLFPPYPVGLKQGGAVGNRHVGWVHLTHAVTRRADGMFVYDFTLTAKTSGRCRFTWTLPGVDGEPVAEGVEIAPGGDYGNTQTSRRPPVWRTGRLTLEVREGSKWRRVGSWWQSGPVPSK